MSRRRAIASSLLALAAIVVGACATNRYEHPRVGVRQRGIASWYGKDFHGKPTASGEIYDMYAMTAAHKELPLGTVVVVRNLENGKSVRVRVNDRGPFIKGRIIDLSLTGARKIDMVAAGTAQVEVEIVQLGRGKPGPTHASSYTVQVGAFRDRTNAESLRSRLADDFDDVEIVSRDGLHRVRVGRTDSRDDALDLRRRLRSRGFDADLVALD